MVRCGFGSQAPGYCGGRDRSGYINHPGLQVLGGSWGLSKWVNHGIIGVVIWLIVVIDLLSKSL